MIQVILGSQLDQLDELRTQIESYISVSFELHDSLYHGGDYFLGNVASCRSEIMVKRNFDVVDRAPVLEEYSDTPLLVYISGNSEVDSLSDQLLAAIPSLRRLERDEVS